MDAKELMEEVYPRKQKIRKCRERVAGEERNPHSWQNSRRVPDWEMRIGIKG